MKPFWKHAGEAAARLRRGRLLVTLDFDGTLAALAETPDKARLEPEYRAALRGLAALPGVTLFILSGRSLGPLRRLVGLRGACYGGNHGAEIAGPGFSLRDAKALSARRELAALAAGLRERFPAGTGVLVEDKVYSVSVHYRNIRAPYRRGFLARMRTLLSARPGALRWRRGHKVFEALPAGSPHKGDALRLVARRLRAEACLAVGDDLTDEDMFRALRGGVTVRVGRKAASAAGYYISGQGEVLRLLRFVAAARRGRGNDGQG